MVFGAGKMLDQSPAESDVQQLMASADTEHGLAGRQEPVKRFKLECVQIIVDRFLGNPVLAVTGRIDVPASRQQETVIRRRIKASSGFSMGTKLRQRIQIVDDSLRFVCRNGDLKTDIRHIPEPHLPVSLLPDFRDLPEAAEKHYFRF